MYIGWDIGIKNLAYCLLKKIIIPHTIINENDKNTYLHTMNNILVFGDNCYQIIDWDVINIVSNVNDKQLFKGEISLPQRPELKCKSESLGKKIDAKPYCGKKAIACAIRKHNNDYVPYCSHHLRRANLDLTEYVDIKLNTCFCHIWDKKKNNICGTKAVFLDKKHLYLGYCKKHYNQIMKTQDDITDIKLEKRDKQEFVNIIKNKKVSSINLTQLADALYDELDKRPSILDAEVVLLENQPVLLNPTMKSVQIFLYSYYVMKGYKNPEKLVNTIQCYMASKKLDIIKLLPIDVYQSIKDEITQIKSQYSRNKKVAIRLTENILATKAINCIKYESLFTKSKKKDDLSDALLMTLHYLEKDIIKKIKIKKIDDSPLLKRKNKISKKTELTAEIEKGQECVTKL
jgi:hypothetical protein